MRPQKKRTIEKTINTTNGYNKNQTQKRVVFRFLLFSVGMAWLFCDGTSHYLDAGEEDLNFKECLKTSKGFLGGMIWTSLSESVEMKGNSYVCFFFFVFPKKKF